MELLEKRNTVMELDPISLFSALGHDTRLRSLMLLSRHRELCVCELTHVIGAAQPHMSRHLAQLRENGLVAIRRQGLWIYYRINPDLPEWARKVLHETAEGLAGIEPFASDVQTLVQMPNQPEAPQCDIPLVERT
jgi:ArsR family transcriptional regulator